MVLGEYNDKVPGQGLPHKGVAGFVINKGVVGAAATAVTAGPIIRRKG